MGLIQQVEAYVASAFPDADLMHPYELVLFPPADARGVMREHRQDLANELLAETCWLIVVGNDPRAVVPATLVEHREIYSESDYDSSSMRDQWFLDVTKPFSLDAMIVNLASAIVLIAPSSGWVLDYLTYAFFASTTEERERTVAAHPEWFR